MHSKILEILEKYSETNYFVQSAQYPYLIHLISKVPDYIDLGVIQRACLLQIALTENVPSHKYAGTKIFRDFLSLTSNSDLPLDNILTQVLWRFSEDHQKMQSIFEFFTQQTVPLSSVQRMLKRHCELRLNPFDDVPLLTLRNNYNDRKQLFEKLSEASGFVLIYTTTGWMLLADWYKDPKMTVPLLSAR